MTGVDDCAEAAVDAAKRINPNAKIQIPLLMGPPNVNVKRLAGSELYCGEAGKANSLGLVARANPVDDL
jgi:hypothetical protein